MEYTQAILLLALLATVTTARPAILAPGEGYHAGVTTNPSYKTEANAFFSLTSRLTTQCAFNDACRAEVLVVNKDSHELTLRLDNWQAEYSESVTKQNLEIASAWHAIKTPLFDENAKNATTYSYDFEDAPEEAVIPVGGAVMLRLNFEVEPYSAGEWNITVMGLKLDPVWISGCGTLSNNSAVNYLTNAVSSGGTCFTIGANNLTLDCQGYSLTGSNAGAGIYLNGYTGIEIRHCYIKDFNYAIYLNQELDDWNKFWNNTLYSSVYDGFWVNSGDHNNQSYSNSSYNGRHGVYAQGSATYFNNSHNLIHDNGQTGVYRNSDTADYGDAHNNTIINNGYTGFAIQDADYLTLTNNTINANGRHGVYLGGSATNTLISDSIINENNGASTLYAGVYIAAETGDYNTFYNNTIFKNYGYGYYLDDGDYNNMSYSNLTRNGVGVFQIRVGRNAVDNTIQGNFIGYSASGGTHCVLIRDDGTDNTNFTYNTVTNCTDYGVVVTGGDNTNISYNNITDSTTHNLGVLLSSNNTIVQNNSITDAVKCVWILDSSATVWHNIINCTSENMRNNIVENQFNTTNPVTGWWEGNLWGDIYDYGIWDTNASGFDGYAEAGGAYPYDTGEPRFFGTGADYGPQTHLRVGEPSPSPCPDCPSTLINGGVTSNDAPIIIIDEEQNPDLIVSAQGRGTVVYAFLAFIAVIVAFLLFSGKHKNE